MAKNIVVVGNCQARPIASVLEKMSDEINITKVAIVHLLKSEEEAEYRKSYQEADYIVAQLVAPNYPCVFVTTEYLKKNYGNKVITIVNLFSKVQHPDWLYIRDSQRIHLLGPLEEYHNATIIKCWAFNKTIADTKLILNHSLFNEYEYSKERENSLEQLKLKEISADVKICDFIDSDMFWTFNHPKSILLIEYANRIFKRLSYEKPKEVESKQESLGKVKIPTNIATKDKAASNFFEVKGSKFSQEDVITRFFSIYNDNRSLIYDSLEKLTNSKHCFDDLDFYYSFCGIESLSLPIPVFYSFEKIIIKVEANFLHLSNVLFEINGEWHGLRSELIKEVKISSVHLDDERFSLESLLNKKTKFFSTKNEKDAYLEVVFHDSNTINRLKVINRPEYSLWNRVRDLKVVGISGDDNRVIYDNRNNLNILELLSIVVSDLENCPSIDQLNENVSFLRFCIRHFNILGFSGIMKAILGIVDKVYLLALSSMIEFNKILFSVKSLLIFIANSKDILLDSKSAKILISYLILNKQLREAFLIYKSLVPSWEKSEVSQFKEIVGNIGRFKFGHDLVPASHSFARPIRDWPKELVFNTIDNILNSTEVEGVKCSFICYGTLLGLYRDKDFIAHDDDVDLLCVVESGLESIVDIANLIKKNLTNLGLKVREAQTNDKNKLPFLMIFDPEHGVHSDLFFGYIDSDCIHLPMANVRYEAIKLDRIMPLSTYTVLEKTFDVPRDIEHFLIERYGKNWSIPDEFFRAKEK
ncbi:WcbI family polysaccharide biosynthesis putative acetyltransferase [Psychrobacter immobilis]|uniref:WcbI family polysaccharide biosynthesis putative acetyltransferase n=1 Tax=Psychrobacter immobilis TaxID=498 RepID=UPI00191AAAE0|nr:WcbI family polysaccharide biosynthesis putative acetyltransferase [Psychrobacter immobilis]